MTAYEAVNPPLESGISASAAGLQSALLLLLRDSSLKRFARLLQGLHKQQLRLALLRWHRAAQYMEWLQVRDCVQQKTGDSHKVLSEEQAREVRELRRQWRAQREALVRERGYAHEDGGQSIALPLDDHEELKRLDKHWRQQLQELHQGHLDNTEYLEATCKKLQGECHSNLRAMVLLAFAPPHNGRSSRNHRERLWAMEDIDPGILQWAFTRPPDPCMVPFPQTVALEEQRQPLASTAKLLLDYMDKLPGWALLASSKRGQRPPVRHPPPRAAGHLMKSVLRRVQVRVMRSAMDDLAAAVPRGMQADGSHPFADFALGRKAWKRVRKAIPRIKAMGRYDKESPRTASATPPLDDAAPESAAALEQRKVRIERPRRNTEIGRARLQSHDYEQSLLDAQAEQLPRAPRGKKKLMRGQTLPASSVQKATENVESEERLRKVTYSIMEAHAAHRSPRRKGSDTADSISADWPFTLGEAIPLPQPRRRSQRLDTRHSSKSIASHSSQGHSHGSDRMSPRAIADDSSQRAMSPRSPASPSPRRNTSPHVTPRARSNDPGRRSSALANSSSMSIADVSPDMLAWAGDTPSAATGRTSAFHVTPNHRHDSSQRFPSTALSSASRERRTDEGSTLVMSTLPDIPSSPAALAESVDIDSSSTMTPAGGEFEVPAPPAPSPAKVAQEEHQEILTRAPPPTSTLMGPAINGAAPLQVLADDNVMSMPPPPPGRMQMWQTADREAAMPGPAALADDAPHQSAAPMTGWSRESPESRPQSQSSRPSVSFEHNAGIQAGTHTVKSLEVSGSLQTAVRSVSSDTSSSSEDEVESAVEKAVEKEGTREVQLNLQPKEKQETEHEAAPEELIHAQELEEEDDDEIDDEELELDLP